MDRPTSSHSPPIALHLLPTNHNNNTQRVDNTTRLLIGLGDCLPPILSNRGGGCYPPSCTRVCLCREANATPMFLRTSFPGSAFLPESTPLRISVLLGLGAGGRLACSRE